jgi:transposase InsO family protein
VEGAGEFYTAPIELQHKRHFTAEAFEVAPTSHDFDVILPFWWIIRHPPTGFTDSQNWRNMAFTSEGCHGCKQGSTTIDKALEYDPSVLEDPQAMIVGFIGTIASQTELDDAIARVPAKYRQFTDIMTTEAASKLPDHKPYDHAIDLKDGETPPWGPIYALNETELIELRKWLKNMLDMGAIRPSKSPCAAPILFVPKPHGRGLRLCVDYRGLNKITIANRYPLPVMSELQDRVRSAKFFTKIDLKNGFHLIRIKVGDEWKTAFRCRYGLFEYTVMPFGLTNAPASFQSMINHIFRDMLDQGMVAFMDDILMYAETEEELHTIVMEVLQRLKDNGLCIAPDKCTWTAHKVDFLGYIVSDEGIAMASDKTQAISDWEPLRSLHDVQSFLGFANFYRRFIKDFSKICHPLTESTKLSAKDWHSSPAIEASFNELKKMFTTAPILKHFEPERPCIVETDASDFALGGVLSQKHELLHPVAFHSRKFSPAEINYDTHDKELLAIVDCFKHWRRYVEGALHQVQVITDHNNLEYFATTKVLNRRQARWAQELAGVDFKIYFRPGRQNTKADALSRRSEHRLEKGGDGQPITTILKPQNIDHSYSDNHAGSAALPPVSSGGDGTQFIISAVRIASIPLTQWTEEFLDEVRKAAKHDPQYSEGLQAATEGQTRREIDDELPASKQAKKPILTIEKGILFRKLMLWVPHPLIGKILESEHDSKVAGHFGQDKTIELIRRNFWWPKMEKDIIAYIQSCPDCQKDKSRRHRHYGLLSPLELPHAPWQSIAMDFIVDLPVSEGCDQLWVVIDRFTKMAHLIPLPVNHKKAEDLARIFAREIWRLHGLPRDIVSDRDSRFTSDVWQVFLATLGIKPRMSTAFHPQTDGQTERVNQTIEAYLRPFVNKEMTNWVELLPMAEHAYNNSVTTATGLTPFYANYGMHPETTTPRKTDAVNPASAVYAHWMKSTIADNMEALRATRERMAKFADKARATPPLYQVGDLVMLNGRHITTKRPARKLDHKFHGPFQIEKLVSPTAVRLTLPVKWKKHPTFHVSEIEPFEAGSRPPPDPAKVLREAADIEAEDEYDVEEIKGSIKRRNRVLYHTQWLGYPRKKDWTFEPYENFSVGGLEKLREFHIANPDSPRDYRLT